MGFVTVKQPVHRFIKDVLRSSAGSSIIADWKIEEETIVKIIAGHLESLGIYYINPSMREILGRDVIFQLKNSHQLLSLVRQMEEQERQRLGRCRNRSRLD